MNAQITCEGDSRQKASTAFLNLPSTARKAYVLAQYGWSNQAEFLVELTLIDRQRSR